MSGDNTEIESSVQRERGKSLSGNLGVASIVFMVVATAAPLTVMVANTPLIISMGNGAGASFDVLVAAGIMLLFCVGFIAMSKYINNAGAFYSYVQKGLGRFLGMGTASTAIFSYSLILIALETYLSFSISGFLSDFLNINVSWKYLTIIIIAAVGFLGYQKIELSSKVLSVVLVLEVSIVIILDFFISKNPNVTVFSDNLFSSQYIITGAPSLGILFAIYCFMGFESTVIYREEVKDPEKTIPRATYISVCLIGAFYIISIWLEIVGVGTNSIVDFANNNPANMYMLLTEKFLGKTFSDTLQVLLITSLFACVLSLHNIIVRYQFVLSRNGAIHKSISYIHRKHGSPHISSFIQTITSLVILALVCYLKLDPVTQVYAWGAAAGTLGYMLILALTSASIIVYFIRNKSKMNRWTVLYSPLLSLIAILSCLVVALKNLPLLIGGNDADAAAIIIKAFMLFIFLSGVLLAVYMRWKSPGSFAQLSSDNSLQ